mmetsp:Transcript_9265/g.18247  ORF Transcript_9265/g.18247 Transcript_9265/m.18247 type:complete len:204 (-) Transcript_9265:165-776(-)|eukprot:CAMPEP_0171501678 /NCGR_PEP_ID=MMETSP0958-20121227/9701_1 /TAXON_ID=87120 /ORGANISM="Aurantiochytrium limacinum, Strain ATCCMYA-1381" /LENGTH=203 /DNA_ID=CAMNT_0012036539 /DNA_START=120 /DNA_END=731 /DNA_ORIENTATION=+
MGGKPSSQRARFLAYREALEARVVDQIIAKFAEDATLTFYNAQDRMPVIFKGKKELENFFALYVQTVPAFRVDIKSDDPVVPAKTDSKDSSASGPKADGKAEGDADNDAERAAMEEAADLASHSSTIAEAVLVASYFDDVKRIASITYKCPAKGYRFVQETFIAEKELFTFASITMDSSTDYAGLALVDHTPVDQEDNTPQDA